MKKRPLLTVCIVGTIYSALILYLAHAWDLGWGNDNYTGYFQKLNWYPYVLFWWPVAAAVYMSWSPFVSAWKDLVDKGLLELASSEDQSWLWGKMQTRLYRWRLGAMWFALTLALLLCIADLYMRDVFSTWSENGCCSYTHNRADCDYTIACSTEGAEPPRHREVFTILAYVQQWAIATMGLLVIFQLLGNVIEVWRIKQGHVLLGGKTLRIRLDPFSPIQEFGFERWNHALNNFYWTVSPAMLVPLISEYEQKGVETFGTIVLRTAGIVLLLAPMFLTIVARQQLLPEAWQQVQVCSDETKIELFHKQRLWPLTKDWSSKLGLIVAFFLLSALLGQKVVTNFIE